MKTRILQRIFKILIGLENLLDEEDYLIATNHDLQHQFGVIEKKGKIDQITR